jgi:hypothetical protein
MQNDTDQSQSNTKICRAHLSRKQIGGGACLFAVVYMASTPNYYFAKILCLNSILQALFQSAQHICGKKEGSGSVPLTNHPDPDGPKTCGSCGSRSGSGSGSPTLQVKRFQGSEPVFLNPYGAQESMPRHQFRQPM